jgi:uncharacterized membrane protein
VPHVAQAVISSIVSFDEWMEFNLAEKAGVFDWIEKVLTFGQIAEKFVATALFFLVVPLIFDWIDRSASSKAVKVVVVHQQEDQEDKTD